MNIEYAATLPLRVILSKIGIRPLQKNGILLLYLSPFHNGDAPTLEVNNENNTWKDSYTNTSGGSLDFVRELLKQNNLNCSVVDGLKWLEFNIGYPSLLESISLPDYDETDRQYIFRYKSSHFSTVNIRYLASRRIPIKLARKHLREVAYINSGNMRECLALGLKNGQGGYAIRSHFIKAIIGWRDISVIHGKAEKKTAIHVFKDIFDYLTAVFIQKGKPFNNDVLILNSYSCLQDSGRYISNMEYRKVYTWFDNGEVGQQATKNYAAFCAALKDTKHKPMNHLYTSAHDANAWLIKQAQKVGR